MLETGWDDDSNMMDDILILEYVYAQEMEQSLGRGVPLMVIKPPPKNRPFHNLVDSMPCDF